MTETAIAFPKDVGEKLRDRLKASFLDVLPDETIDAMIKAEWDDFFKPKTQSERRASWYGVETKDQYNDIGAISPFVALVRKLILEHFTKTLQARLEPELSAIQWPEGSPTLVSQIVSESSEALMRAATKTFIETIVFNIRNCNPR